MENGRKTPTEKTRVERQEQTKRKYRYKSKETKRRMKTGVETRAEAERARERERSAENGMNKCQTCISGFRGKNQIYPYNTLQKMTMPRKML